MDSVSANLFSFIQKTLSLAESDAQSGPSAIEIQFAQKCVQFFEEAILPLYENKKESSGNDNSSMEHDLRVFCVAKMLVTMEELATRLPFEDRNLVRGTKKNIDAALLEQITDSALFQAPQLFLEIVPKDWLLHEGVLGLYIDLKTEILTTLLAEHQNIPYQKLVDVLLPQIQRSSRTQKLDVDLPPAYQKLLQERRSQLKGMKSMAALAEAFPFEMFKANLLNLLKSILEGNESLVETSENEESSCRQKREDFADARDVVFALSSKDFRCMIDEQTLFQVKDENKKKSLKLSDGSAAVQLTAENVEQQRNGLFDRDPEAVRLTWSSQGSTNEPMDGSGSTSNSETLPAVNHVASAAQKGPSAASVHRRPVGNAAIIQPMVVTVHPSATVDQIDSVLYEHPILPAMSVTTTESTARSTPDIENRAPTARSRRPGKPWSDLEVRLLEEGMLKHGRSWAVILDEVGHGENKFASTRTKVDLKDKARNEARKRLRHNVPLGVFEGLQ